MPIGQAFQVLDYTRDELTDDVLPSLHEEIAQLSMKLRLPIVLWTLAALTGGVRARDDKTAAQGRGTTNLLAAVAPVPQSPARVAGTGTPPMPAAVLHTNAGKRDEKSQATVFESLSSGVAARMPAAPAAPPPVTPVAPAKAQTDGGINKPGASGEPTRRVWTFSFSIGRDRPFLIKGTIAEGAGDRPDAIDP